ncbi:MAG TPA: helix-hairpin-helix domain-containing protein [Acidimicrobiia bacterium]|nr:helix-hairpin-helix domain-containing protein [Acidimicrobiia bacterium]
MTTEAQLRKAALALPEVVEGTHFGMVAFLVREKGFASVTPDGQVQLYLPDDDADAALADHPSAERLVRMGTPIGVRIPLADLDGQALNHLVRRAWFSRAPKRLAAVLAQADAASPGEGDLPPSIGRPATQALVGAGITTLDDVAARSEQELLAMHGVGPKAVRILAEALAERQRSWRTE